jgi:hypothetical protein
VVNRIHVAVPKPRDNASRPPVIPPGVAAARARRDAGEKRRTEKDLQVREAGVTSGTNWLAWCNCRLTDAASGLLFPPLLTPPSRTALSVPPACAACRRSRAVRACTAWTCASGGTSRTPPGATISCPKSWTALTWVQGREGGLHGGLESVVGFGGGLGGLKALQWFAACLL